MGLAVKSVTVDDALDWVSDVTNKAVTIGGG